MAHIHGSFCFCSVRALEGKKIKSKQCSACLMREHGEGKAGRRGAFLHLDADAANPLCLGSF